MDSAMNSMISRARTLIGAGFLALVLSGCSVGMAMSGSKAPDLGHVKVGATRGEVELQMGPPIKTNIDELGRRIDIYEYEIGNEPSPGRAVGHAAMDVLTLGIWEIVGTPVEGFTGEKYHLTVTYSAEDTVEKVSSQKIGGGA